MAIYRGTGGSGDSTQDTTLNAVTEQATNANSSASAAATSATSASTSASTATTQATAASTSATNAATSATNAATSETNAATSETNAATSETNAATSETNAATSETNASTSETNAATSETNASASATSASTSATTATTQATTATTQASTATTKAAEALASQTAAASSETSASTDAATATTQAATATTKASEASASATAAATSETNAATSATNAAASESSVATNATNAATSETNAATSETNAATSETNAATSATTATTKASEASTSATNAAASATAAATSATAAQTAETAAETAETNAETAQTAAEAAETAAEAAETAATASETAAAASQASATASANSATASANSASSSATDAQSSEDDAATSEVNAANSASAASSSASAASSSATNAATSATSAAASLASFTGQYSSQATAPSSPTTGDLWFDETADIMKVYDGSLWVNAGSSVNGVENSVEYTATANQTTFSVTYDVGYVEVYLNGIRLDRSDYTATNGTSIVLDVGAAVGDSVFIHAFGTFALADHYNKVDSDARYALGTQVLTDVPANAVFTDTTYTKPSAEPISYITNLQTTLDAKLPLAGGTLTGGLNVNGTTQLDSGATDEVLRIEGTGSPYMSWYDSGVRQAYIGSFGNSFDIVGDTPDTQVKILAGNATRATFNSTGVDVTGTVTADALFSGPNATSGLNYGYISSIPTNSSAGFIGWAPASVTGLTNGDLTYVPRTSAGSNHLFYTGLNTPTKSLRIAGNGDISFYEDTGTTAKFFWDASAESLGIGTTSPDKKLHVEGGMLLDAYNVGEDEGIFFREGFLNIDQPSITVWDKDNGGVSPDGLSINSNDGIRFRENGGEVARFDDGNLGIGTSSPEKTLHVNSGTTNNVAIFESTDSDTRIELRDSSSTHGANTISVTADDMYFSTDTSERMRIDSSGNVGIGRAPRTRLEIASGNAGGDAGLDAPVLRITNTTASGDWDYGDLNGKIEFWTDDSSGNAAYDTAFIQSEGNNSNGTLPSGALVFGTATYNAVGGAVERMRIDSSGRVTTPYQPSFSAYITTDVTGFSNGTNYKIQCNATTHNTGNHFSTSTYMFTAPVDGVYQFNVLGRFNNIGTGYHLVRLYVNSGAHPGSYCISQDTGSYNTVSLSNTIQLSANDTVVPYMYASGDTNWTMDNNCSFSGFLVG